jgi:predicted polyphosphate/ATP-dependent NAD kinase
MIVNPMAGRDVRRLVGLASQVTNHEKTAICRRLLAGVAAVGVEQVWLLPDDAGITRAAAEPFTDLLDCRWLPMQPRSRAEDSVQAASLLAGRRVGAIVMLGGDGTARAVAAGSGEVPLVAVSTGTNNVVPSMIDGTVAGMAAGLVANGAVSADSVTTRAKRVEVMVDGTADVALVDVAVCRERFIGSRAIWDPSSVSWLALARAEAWSVGLSAVGGWLHPLPDDAAGGLLIRLGDGGSEVLAPVAPGLIVRVPVRSWTRVAFGETVDLPVAGGTVALDGERALTIPVARHGAPRVQVTFSRDGPRIVDIRATVTAAAGRSRA